MAQQHEQQAGELRQALEEERAKCATALKARALPLSEELSVGSIGIRPKRILRHCEKSLTVGHSLRFFL